MVCIFDASALFEVSTGSIMHSETVGRVLGRSFSAVSGRSLRSARVTAVRNKVRIRCGCANVGFSKIIQ